MRQVLVNLIGNGLKFTHRGEVRVDVDVDPDADAGTRLRITVRDTGIGMSEHQIERIFLPFTQANASTTRTYGGSGLGLSICRRIADHLGGTLEVESTLGLGSVFTFTVPVGPAEPGNPSATQQAGPDRSALRVLLAEDDVVNQMVAVRMLGRLGVRAEVVADGHRRRRGPRDRLRPGVDGRAHAADGRGGGDQGHPPARPAQHSAGGGADGQRP